MQIKLQGSTRRNQGYLEGFDIPVSVGEGDETHHVDVGLPVSVGEGDETHHVDVL